MEKKTLTLVYAYDEEAGTTLYAPFGLPDARPAKLAFEAVMRAALKGADTYTKNLMQGLETGELDGSDLLYLATQGLYVSMEKLRGIVEATPDFQAFQESRGKEKP